MQRIMSLSGCQPNRDFFNAIWGQNKRSECVAYYLPIPLFHQSLGNVNLSCL